MTVIAWDGKTLAADKRASSDGLILTVTKIRRVKGLLVGVAGNMSSGVAMMNWLAGRRKTFPTCQSSQEDWAQVLVIDGTRILTFEQTPIPVEFEDRFFAIGSGRAYALAAMHCGRSAREAIEIACQYDNGCGNGVDTLTLIKPRGKRK